jgi:hypothetical protein
VAYSELVQNALKKMLERARQLGVLANVLASVKEIDSRLHSDPTVFGEATMDTKDKRGQARISVVRLVSVQFVVFAKEHKVIVTRPLTLLAQPGPNPP